MNKLIENLEEIGKSNIAIEDIYIYGSYARGESDIYSDIDILVVINTQEYKDIINIKDNMKSKLNIPRDWISIYSYNRIEEMKQYGAYFLWHLKLEGKKVYSRKRYLENTLKSIPKYKKCKMDLIQYNDICIDIENSVKKEQYNIYYELNVLASIVRNASIAFCFLNNKYIFSRYKPVKFVIDSISKNIGLKGINIDIREYDELYKYRIIYNRGGLYPERDDLIEFLLKWINIAKYIINMGINMLEDGELEDEKYNK